MTGLGWVLQQQGLAATPLVSIVTVMRRDFDNARRTILSVADANIPGVELVIVEGDDRDSAASRSLRSLVSTLDITARWCLFPDGGIYDAMNRGVMASSGRWLWFVNAGDTINPGSTQSMLDAVRNSTGGWVVCSADVAEQDSAPHRRKRAEDYSETKLTSGAYTPCHQAVLMDRYSFALAGPYDTRYRVAADYKVFLRLARLSAPCLVYGPSPVTYLDGGFSATSWRRLRWEQVFIRREVLPASNRAHLLALARAGARTALPRSFRSAPANLHSQQL